MCWSFRAFSVADTDVSDRSPVLPRRRSPPLLQAAGGAFFAAEIAGLPCPPSSLISRAAFFGFLLRRWRPPRPMDDEADGSARRRTPGQGRRVRRRPSPRRWTYSRVIGGTPVRDPVVAALNRSGESRARLAYREGPFSDGRTLYVLRRGDARVERRQRPWVTSHVDAGLIPQPGNLPRHGQDDLAGERRRPDEERLGRRRRELPRGRRRLRRGRPLGPSFRETTSLSAPQGVRA